MEPRECSGISRFYEAVVHRVPLASLEKLETLRWAVIRQSKDHLKQSDTVGRYENMTQRDLQGQSLGLGTYFCMPITGFFLAATVTQEPFG
jgi:hypothetical protein